MPHRPAAPTIGPHAAPTTRENQRILRYEQHWDTVNAEHQLEPSEGTAWPTTSRSANCRARGALMDPDRRDALPAAVGALPQLDVSNCDAVMGVREPRLLVA